ncbi:MAG: hypothetical protein JEZ09_10145 [Salinivirgaceae bacterium]|nr:hypothetical protein [Salinivirgaceae bacterium]
MGKSLAIRIISILFIALFSISVLLGIIFFINKNENPLLIWMYALIIAAIGITLVFMLANVFKTKKSLITSLLIAAGFGVFVLISYVLASSTIPLQADGIPFDNITEVGSRWSGTILYLLYFLLGGSFLTLIFTEIRGAIK